MMTSAQIEVKDYRYFAGNQWRKTADDQFFEVHEPYSGRPGDELEDWLQAERELGLGT
jgi:hypothetical protein